MYRLAWRTLKSNLSVVGILAVSIGLLDTFLAWSFIAGGVLFAYMFVAFIAHRTALQGGDVEVFSKNPKAPGKFEKGAFSPFLWRYCLLFGLLSLGLLGVFFQLSHIVAVKSEETVTLVLLSAVFVLPVLWIGLAAGGTVFPAAASGGNAGLRAALGRARGTFFRTLGRLVALPFAFQLLGMALTVAMTNAAFSAQVSEVASTILVGTVSAVVGLSSTVLTAVVLSLAYLEAEATPAE